MRIVRILLILIGLFGIADTALISTVSSPNLGVLLPAILGAPLLLAGLFAPKLAPHFAQGFGAVCKWAFFGLYGLLFAAIIVTWAVIDHNAQREPPADADVVIVLGAALRGETPTLVLRNRLDTAIGYLNENPNTIAILSGGKGDDEFISEAEGMARYLTAAGIDESRFIREDQSTSTEENFAFSNDIIQQRFGPTATIVFVTTDFHVYRAGKVANKQGIATQGLAANDVWYISLNNHLRECFALWAYLILGKI
ncbi:YdcF family protein [Eubacteriales bacterium OttesenSCG-928-K08]|nr:YdcF family protein [Eubacteriales bacterium OttesenSCG-928-K08]